MPFSFSPTAIPDVIIVTPRVHRDERGFFLETFREEEFRDAGLPTRFEQDNHSRSSRGTVRGLHFQSPPHEQGKLVRVAHGAVMDVTVDIRRGSPWYGQHVAVELSEENHRTLWVPPGFAHGFCALEDGTDLLYKVTRPYAPAAEGGLRYDDPGLGIDWPLPDGSLLVSDRDAGLPSMDAFESPFVYQEE